MSGLDHRHTSVTYLLSVFLVLDILAPGLSTKVVFLSCFGYSSDFSSWTYVDMNGDDVYDGATKLWRVGLTLTRQRVVNGWQAARSLGGVCRRYSGWRLHYLAVQRQRM